MMGYIEKSESLVSWLRSPNSSTPGGYGLSISYPKTQRPFNLMGYVLCFIGLAGASPLSCGMQSKVLIL